MLMTPPRNIRHVMQRTPVGRSPPVGGGIPASGIGISVIISLPVIGTCIWHTDSFLIKVQDDSKFCELIEIFVLWDNISYEKLKFLT